MVIVYCDACGLRIPQKDVDAGALVYEGNRALCERCAANPAPRSAPAPLPDDEPDEQPQAAPEPERPSGVSITPARGSRSPTRVVTRAASDKRTRSAASRPGDGRGHGPQEFRIAPSRTPLFIAAGGGMLLLIAAAVFIFKGKKSDEAANASGGSAPVAADLSKKNDPQPAVKVAADGSPKSDSASTDAGRAAAPDAEPKKADPDADKKLALPSWMRTAEPVGTVERQPLLGEFVWIDDALPSGAVAMGNSQADAWKWVSTPPPLMGNLAHTYSGAAHNGPGELRQHYFEKTSNPLNAGTADTFFAYVYIDPANPPKTIMMQWRFGDNWEHRAYWGDNVIPFGQNFSPSRVPMGTLPAAGEWVRLEVPAASVGLNAIEDRVTGWSFDHWGGNAYWDKAGVVRAPMQKPPKPPEPPPAVAAVPVPEPVQAAPAGTTGTLARFFWKNLSGGREYFNFFNKGKNSKAIWAKTTPLSTLSATFDLPEGKYGAGALLITSLRHGHKETCLINIEVNGTQIFDGRDPTTTREWAVVRFAIPENVLKGGKNEFKINNIEPKGNLNQDPWYMVHLIEVEGVLAP